MKEDGKLSFLSGRFQVETCVGKWKLFTELSNWELLNLKPDVILDIPDRLYQEFGTLIEFEVITLKLIRDRNLQRIPLAGDCHHPVDWKRHY